MIRMVYRWLKNSTLVARVLLLVFATALTSSSLCDLGYIEYGPKHVHKAVAEEHSHHQQKAGHHHEHSKNEDLLEKESHQSENSDECCDDIAAALLASFQVPVDSQRVDAGNYYLVYEITNFTLEVELWAEQVLNFHKYDDPPPFRGRGTILLKQSFLI